MSFNPVKTLVVLMIRIYQYAISPLLGRHCRFYPSCSAYARESFERHGLLMGTFLTMKRLLCCHPWHPGGYDPVPGSMTRRVGKGKTFITSPSKTQIVQARCAAPQKTSPDSYEGHYPAMDKPFMVIKLKNQNDTMAR